MTLELVDDNVADDDITRGNNSPVNKIVGLFVEGKADVGSLVAVKTCNAANTAARLVSLFQDNTQLDAVSQTTSQCHVV